MCAPNVGQHINQYAKQNLTSIMWQGVFNTDANHNNNNDNDDDDAAWLHKLSWAFSQISEKWPVGCDTDTQMTADYFFTYTNFTKSAKIGAEAGLWATIHLKLWLWYWWPCSQFHSQLLSSKITLPIFTLLWCDIFLQEDVSEFSPPIHSTDVCTHCHRTHC